MKRLFKDTTDTTESSEPTKESPQVLDVIRNKAKQRKQEASSSYHSDSYHSETSYYSPDKGLPSEQMVKLKNGMYASARDIEWIENLRHYASGMGSYRRMFFLELKEKCENSTYQLSKKSYDQLVKQRLIDMQGKPSESVRNIVLNLSERDCLFDADEPVATQVKLRNSTEEHYNVVDDIMGKLNKINPDILSELCMFCKDSNHILQEGTAEVLRSAGLIDERTRLPSDSVKNIISCSIDEEGRLCSPAMRMYKLLIMLEKTTQNKTEIEKLKEKKILRKMYPRQYTFEMPKLSDHSLDKFLPSELEVKLENGMYASAIDIRRITRLRNDGAATGGRKKNVREALADLLEKCKSSTHQLSKESYDQLVKRGLISEQGQPSNSVKNIILYLFEQNRVFDLSLASITTQVKLRNGTEEHYKLVFNTMSALRNIKEIKHESIFELYKLCKNSSHTLENETVELLKSKGLIDECTGQPSDSIKNIVLCSFNEELGKLEAPDIPYKELENKVRKPMIKKKVREILIFKELKEKVDELTEAGTPKKLAGMAKELAGMPKDLIELIEDKVGIPFEGLIEYRIKKIQKEFPNELQEEQNILKYIYWYQGQAHSSGPY